MLPWFRFLDSIIDTRPIRAGCAARMDVHPQQ